jgi:ArsR family transcriptional regulator
MKGHAASSARLIAPKFRDTAKCDFFLNLLSLLANRYRFRILCLLADGDRCVADITAQVGGQGSNISQQLKTLTLAGSVTKRREGKMVYYGLRDTRIRRLLQFLNALWEDNHR